MCARPSISPRTSAARWCWAFPTTCRRSNTWRTSPTRPRRCTSRGSGACSPIRKLWPRWSRGWRDGQAAADIYLRSDARAGIEAILAGLDKTLGAGKPTAATIRSKELAHRIATEPPDAMAFDIEPGVLDPREVVSAIDAAVPKDWDVVVGGGHQAYFPAQMVGRP